ncbi:MAG: hypothetical protein RR415_06330 [Ruthenibacterium sp.]
MRTSNLVYTVGEGEYMRNWLTGSVVETPFVAKMVQTVFENYHPGASVKKPDGKERTSPAKDEFLQKAIFKHSSYPKLTEIDNLYWPFDTQRVDFSGFWHLPCDITFYAKAFIQCEEDCVHSLEICTCGAIKMWVNQILNAEFYPYESNLEAKTKVTIALKKGINEIVVGCNNYGERNIVFNFGVKNMGEKLNVCLPVSADIDKMQSINISLQSMYLDKLSYTQGEVTICTDDAFEYDCVFCIKVCKICKTITVNKGDNKLIWGDAAQLPIGYHEFCISCNVDGVLLTKTLWAEAYPKKFEMATPKSFEERKNQVFDFIIKNTQPTLEQYIAYLQKGENKYDTYKEEIETIVTHVQNRGDCSDFRVVKILWILNKFKHLLTDTQIKYFEDTLLNFRYWYDEKGNDAMWFFSENHALCFHTGQMLAGEMFENRIFTNSGLTGAQQSEKAKKLIVEWLEKLLKYGYNEWNSAAYIPVDMLSYISLLELCCDKQVKLLAEKALDYTYEIFARNSFNGLLATSNGRTYPRDLLANRDLGTNPLMWLAWGKGCLNSHVEPLIFIALSKYCPPARFASVANWNKKEKLIVVEEQGTFKVPTMLCKTKDYILGTCVTPRTGGLGSQEHLLNIFIKDYQSRIWINHPGESKIFGEKRPGYFTGNGLTPLVSQQANTAVMSYNFSDELLKCAEVNFTHAFCDMSVCDEVIVDSNWVFIKRDDTFVALYSTNGITINKKAPLKDKELVSPGINTTWFVKVCAIPEIKSFEAFVAWYKSNTPVINGKKLSIQDFEYGNIDFCLM